MTNSSSTSYVLGAKDVDTIIEEIKERKLFGKYNDIFLTELEKEGFYRVLIKDNIMDSISEAISFWNGYDENQYPEISNWLYEQLSNSEIFDNKLLVVVKINYQGDGHDAHCIRDDDWHHRMTRTGEWELVDGIFEKDFIAFIGYFEMTRGYMWGMNNHED